MIHCQTNFRGKMPQEDETWRELFIRCQYERDQKLKLITSSIQMHQALKKPGILFLIKYLPSGINYLFNFSTAN